MTTSTVGNDRRQRYSVAITLVQNRQPDQGVVKRHAVCDGVDNFQT